MKFYESLDHPIIDTEKLKEQALNSTSHGLTSIFKTCLKLMWLCLFLVGISFGIYTGIESIKSYLSFEVVTSIKLISEIPLLFPTITFYTSKTLELIYQEI